MDRRQEVSGQEAGGKCTGGRRKVDRRQEVSA